jgi:protein-disulfide isomerase
MHKPAGIIFITTLFVCIWPLSRGEAGDAKIAAKIDWNKIVNADISALSAEEKIQVEKTLLSLENTYGCKGTIAACMEKGDLTARRNAGFVVRMVKKEKDDAYIAKYLALRKESAHPKEVATLDTTVSPMRGRSSAPITIVEFECFQCPFCAHLAPQLKTFHQKFGDKIVEYFKFYPLRSHPRGVAAASAALAAHQQGKFWEMHEVLFEHRANLEDADIEKYAASINLDTAKFNAARKDPALLKTVEKDKLEGMRFGVDGTPTFFINGKRYQAAYDIDEINDRIEEELDIVEGRIPK